MSDETNRPSWDDYFINLVDEFYAPEMERGARWNDPAFGIDWPLEPTVVSKKDEGHPDFDIGGSPKWR